MADQAATAALTKAASALHAAARDHKLREGQHRKQARALMWQLGQLRVFCAEHGIDLIETSTDPEGKGHS